MQLAPAAQLRVAHPDQLLRKDEQETQGLRQLALTSAQRALRRTQRWHRVLEPAKESVPRHVGAQQLHLELVG